MPTMNSPVIPLTNGAAMPAIGLGTWPLDDDEVARTVVDAVQIGYRLIDTADKYGNETGVGKGIRDVTGPGGLDRSELFVTTKLDGPYQGNGRAVRGLDESLRRLGLEYVDLLLIHWPLPARDLYVETWQTFATLLAAGKTRAIGVSNFKPAHLDRLIGETGVTPAVNQIELNPTLARTSAREYNAAHGILTQSWSPLGRGETLSNPVIAGIAERINASPARVILRWHYQLGLSAVPKSATRARLVENLNIFGIELSDVDMAAISGLDLGETAATDSDVAGH